MNCGDAKERLSPLLDGELDDAEAVGVRAHLGTCERCRAHHAELLAIAEALRGAPRAPAPEGFAAGVLTALAGRRRGRLPRLVPLAGLAAAAALLLAVLLAPRSSTIEPGSRATEVARETDPPEEIAPRTWTGGAEMTAPPPADSVFPSGGSRRDLEKSGDIGPGSPPPAGPSESAVDDARPGLTAGPESAGRDAGSFGPALRFVVAGGEPDAAAGRILAELDHRRRANRLVPGDGPADGCSERIVADVHGEPRAMVLCLTPDEVRYVLSLLGEQDDLEVTRRNGAVAGPRAAPGPGTDRKQVEILFEAR
jgi:anti-sigma factor RsiW